jgi:hypothetical protein
MWYRIVWQKFNNVSEEQHDRACSWREISSKRRHISTISRRPIPEVTHAHRREYLKSHVILCVHTVSEISASVLKQPRQPLVAAFLEQNPHSRSKYVTSENSVVGMRTGRRTGRPRNLVSIPGRSKRFVFSPKHPGRFLGPFSLSFSKAKQPGREADYPFSLCEEVKNERISISTTPLLHDIHNHK